MGWIMKFDVFISHASEDKGDFVQALAQELEESGLSVWYDAFILRLGDSLSESINMGLSQSTYGIVVLSQSFFRKKWPKRELNALLNREDIDGKVMDTAAYDQPTVSYTILAASSLSLLGMLLPVVGVIELLN